MMNILPLRRTTLHLAQRFRIDGETFISDHTPYSFIPSNQGFNYTRSSFFRLDYTKYPFGSSWDSQDERVSFGDGNRVLKMSRQ
jgi:hypothetical protein